MEKIEENNRIEKTRDLLQCSCLENPMDRGAWWADVYGVAQSRTRLKRLSSSSSRDLFKTIRHTKGTFHAKLGSIKDRNGMDQTETEDIKNRWQYTKNNYTKKVLMIQITTMVWSVPRARHPGEKSQVVLRKHYCKQSYWRWWNSSWGISNPNRWCC